MWIIQKEIFKPEIFEQFFTKYKFDVYNHIKSFKQAQPHKIKLLFATYYKNNKIEGIAIIQKFKICATEIKAKSLWKTCIVNSLLGVIPFDIAYLGNIFCIAFPGFDFINSYTVQQRKNALDELNKKMSSSLMVVKNITSSELFIEFKADKHYACIEKDSTMELFIQPQWQNFNDYINALTKKYKQRTLKIINNFNGIEVRNFDLTAIEKYKNEIYNLYEQVIEKQIFRIGKVEPNYFYEMKKNLSNDFLVTGYFKNNELVAFRSAFMLRNRIEVHLVGFDYKLNSIHNIYFNLLFDSIKLAIENKIETLELGRTARDAKANVGAKPLYFNDAIFFKHRYIKKIYEFIDKNFNNNTQNGPERNPFKKID